MGQKTIEMVGAAVVLAGLFTAIGYVWGHERASEALAAEAAETVEVPQPCPTGETEMCVDLRSPLREKAAGAVEFAAAEERSLKLKACESEIQDITINGLPELINVRIASAECEGMLKECRRK